MYKLLLIWRYFVAKRVALLAVAAVALVVMLVLVVLSVMSGLLENTRSRNHRWTGDVVLSRASLVGFPFYDEFIAELEGHAEVARATPVVKTYGLIEQRNTTIELYGLRMDEFCRVTGFRETLHRFKDRPSVSFMLESELYVTLSEEARGRGCIVGHYMLDDDIGDSERELMAHYPLGWNMTVFGLSSQGVLLGSDMGSSQRFWYVDDSDSGLPRVDGVAVYVDFDELQQLCFMNGVDGEPARANEIRVCLADGVDAVEGEAVVQRVWGDFVVGKRELGQARLLEDVRVQSWQEFRRSYIAPAEKERNLMVVVFCMIGVVAVFVVFAIFYMIVMEKVKDLGVIKSVGASGWSLGQVFLGYGILVGLVGALIGSSFGVLIVRNSNEIEAVLHRWFGFQLWNPAVYAIDKIPDVVYYGQALVIGLAAIGASVLGAIIPAWRAARLEVVESLRVE
ncbi:MAG: ABC transporter permease [Sedimentisphaerales bacterium]|nr:ABC transporter permease [Sedimentisphaerales bacterium]